LRSRCGKRRSATSATSAGVMSAATISSATSTMTGVTAKITISGASTVLSLPAPRPSSQPHSRVIQAEDSSVTRTHSSAGSQ
jgi:hypothetical protein